MNEANSVQQPLPLAFVNGEAVIEQPQDLYIPPDALEVILETFEGPLDLLLYLIRKQKVDILSMPVADITRQYMEYVDVMKTLRLELAGEYLLMAAILAEIKSRLLLPKRADAPEDEEDPRAELIRRLQEYERVQKAAHELDLQPRLERDHFVAIGDASVIPRAERLHPDVSLRELVLAFGNAMKRAEAFEHHQIAPEKLSTRERMSAILAKLKSAQPGEFISFSLLFTPEEGKSGVVVSFLASLELLKEQLIVLVQSGPASTIHIALTQDE
jgi:segregation and condensation protein A